MLYLIRGLPGSGKSTLAKQLEKSLAGTLRWKRIFHVEADMYFMVDGEYKFDPSKLPAAHAFCQETTQNYLENGMDVIVSNTFTTKKEMMPYLQMAQDNGIQVQIILCQGTFGLIHSVPDHAMERMKARFEYSF